MHMQRLMYPIFLRTQGHTMYYCPEPVAHRCTKINIVYRMRLIETREFHCCAPRMHRHEHPRLLRARTIASPSLWERGRRLIGERMQDPRKGAGFRNKGSKGGKRYEISEDPPTKGRESCIKQTRRHFYSSTRGYPSCTLCVQTSPPCCTYKHFIKKGVM